MAEKVVVKGLAEVEASLARYEAGIDKAMRSAARLAGNIVMMDARSRFSAIDVRSARGFRVKVRARGVSVEQRLGRVTGKRPDYGALQMTRALLPALGENEAKAGAIFETAIDALSIKSGF